MKNFFSQKANILVFLLSLGYFVFIFLNIDLFKVPHGDIYQYIGDAKSYAEFRFPGLIQLQPLMPILMAILRPLFSGFEYPYFATAKFINLISATASFFIAYQLLKQYVKPLLALLVSFLCLVHPLSILISMDITTVSFYAVFALASLYFIDKNEKLFFFLASVAFLIRVEGLVLLAVYFVYNFDFIKSKIKITKAKNKKTFEEKLKNKRCLILYLAIVLIWTSIQTFHNYQNKIPYGNYYFFELAEKSFDKKNFIYLFGLTEAFFLPKNLEVWSLNNREMSKFSIIFIVFTSCLISQLIIFKKSRALGLYIFFMALVHSFFPAIENRYFYLFLYPYYLGACILIFEYFIKITNKSLRKISFFSVILGITFYGIFVLKNFQNLFMHYRNTDQEIIYTTSKWIFNLPDNNKEYYLITNESFLYYDLYLNSREYLNKHSSRNTVNTTFDNGIISFKISDKKTINFVDLAFIKDECQDSVCLLDKIGKKNANYLIVSDWLTEHYNEKFWIHKNGVFLIRGLLAKQQCLSKLAHLSDEYSYKIVLRLDLDCYQNN